MQLMVYSIAAIEMYKSGEFEGFSGELEPEVKGVFYDKLRNDFVECDFGAASDVSELLIEKLRLDGVVFSREGYEKTTKYLDSSDAENMDYEISAYGASKFLKIVKKAKSAGLDRRRSSAESDELRDAILKYVKDGLIEADINIKSGDVEVSPYKYKSQSGSACEYCPYGQICALDREKGPCRKRERSKKEITDEILGTGVE